MKTTVISIKAIIFDMDGVITNTMPDHFHAWRDVLATEGVAISHFDVYSREGQQGLPSLKEILAEHNVYITDRKARTLLKAKEERFKEIAQVRFIQGSRSFLKSLYRKGFKFGLVTGTSRHELVRILPDHLYRMFNTIVTGCDVKNGKPHPEPYLQAIRKLDIKAQDAIVIENAPCGIDSAKEAGLKCFALETSLPKKYLRRANKIFSSYNDLIRHVEFKCT